jgi:SOS response regulatory protein OraA/RecX
LDPENIEHDTYEKAKERALRLLARRDHSVRELKQKLSQRLELRREDLEDLIIYLKERGYLASEDDSSRCHPLR